METPKAKLPVGTNVQFTETWLSALSSQESRRYKDRVGMIGGYRGQITDGTPLPIVNFEKAGRLKAERFFEVPWDRLEVVHPQQSKI